MKMCKSAGLELVSFGRIIDCVEMGDMGQITEDIKCHAEEFRHYAGANGNLPKISSDQEIT